MNTTVDKIYIAVVTRLLLIIIIINYDHAY